MTEAMLAVEEVVLGLAGSPWILLAVVVLATIDGFFPPVPSESVIIAVAVLTVAGGGPSLWFLILAGAVGAFCGDLIAYTIGTKVPIDRLRIFASPRGQSMLRWAKRALARRGTVFILSARFVPIGRVAVNMTAGAVGFPRRRFVIIVAIAAVVWASYSTLLGMSAGVFLHDHPLVAVAIGVAGGVFIGFGVDMLLGLVQRRWFPSLPTPEELLEDEATTPGPDGGTRRTEQRPSPHAPGTPPRIEPRAEDGWELRGDGGEPAPAPGA
ncbi:DedA family protein [Georgenia yuyongxinii]|uniref:DedA family protein n=1 Tax=Georgenia yuyongxinii TaxID=2589797 RepID=A0A5B8C6R0_9MICO|nr:DedA family protein [Georgenia yuyongxinii]QDC25847.1 DedA family protein [Georgenia yuyongxinii]